MKKILIVNIGTEIGGIEKCLINFLRYLITRDCQVDLLLWKPPGPLFSQIPETVNVLNRPGPGSFSEIIKEKSIKEKISKLKVYYFYKKCDRKGEAWKALPKLDNEYDIAISYCQNGHSPYYVLDNVNANQKYMFYHHGSYDKDKADYEYDKIAYSRFNKIITVSQANKSMLLKHFPNLDNHFEVINNLIDENDIIRQAEEPIVCFKNNDKLKISTVGRISHEKGHHFALQVANALKNENVDFEWIFVGEGPEKENCIKYVEENGLDNYCRFIGAKENPYPYIKQSDIYVQTSFVESYSITIREAIVLHKKMVVSDIPAVKENLSGITFAVVSELNVDSFVNKIILMNNIDAETNFETADINTLSLKKMDLIFDL